VAAESAVADPPIDRSAEGTAPSAELSARVQADAVVSEVGPADGVAEFSALSDGADSDSDGELSAPLPDGEPNAGVAADESSSTFERDQRAAQAEAGARLADERAPTFETAGAADWEAQEEAAAAGEVELEEEATAPRHSEEASSPAGVTAGGPPLEGREDQSDAQQDAAADAASGVDTERSRPKAERNPGAGKLAEHVAASLGDGADAAIAPAQTPAADHAPDAQARPVGVEPIADAGGAEEDDSPRSADDADGSLQAFAAARLQEVARKREAAKRGAEEEDSPRSADDEDGALQAFAAARLQEVARKREAEKQLKEQQARQRAEQQAQAQAEQQAQVRAQEQRREEEQAKAANSAHDQEMDRSQQARLQEPPLGDTPVGSAGAAMRRANRPARGAAGATRPHLVRQGPRGLRSDARTRARGGGGGERLKVPASAPPFYPGGVHVLESPCKCALPLRSASHKQHAARSLQPQAAAHSTQHTAHCL
jgi:hypothetical protein